MASHQSLAVSPPPLPQTKNCDVSARKRRRRCVSFCHLCSCTIRPNASVAGGQTPDVEIDSAEWNVNDLDMDFLVGQMYCDAHCHLDYVLRNLQSDGGYDWVYKNIMCRWWESGRECPYGEWCNYAHGEVDLRKRCPLEVRDIEMFTRNLALAGTCEQESRHPGDCLLQAVVMNCCELESLSDTLFLIGRAEQEFQGVLYCTFGCHPSNYRNYDDAMEKQLLEAFASCGPRAVAWGECGLDYCKNDKKMDFDRTRMIEVFARQARLAVERSLPLVVHSRDADVDTLEVLRELPRQQKVHVHGFMGAVETMREVLEMLPNSIFGIPGLIGRDNPWPEAVEIARHCPLDRLVLETDAPFVCNGPEQIPWMAAKIAKIKGGGLHASDVLEKSTANCCAFYGIPATKSYRATMN